MVKQIFVNVAVKDLEASKQFWTKVGLTFNPQFTDEKAASLVIGENIFAMLIVPKFFSTFTKKQIIDPHDSIEAINALGVESRQEVDDMYTKAISAGGKETRPADDYGWMYTRSFEDIDGHQWELLYIDSTKVPTDPAANTAKKN